MTRPRLLDLFCGAGGAAMGYVRAGFDVVGVDIRPQPHYPFTFHQGDALTFPLDGFDAIHASPPCQAFSVSTNYRPENRTKYPDLVAPIRERLIITGLPYVIENVPGAPLHNPIVVCGAGLGMNLRRHRLFESNVPMWGVPCAHGQQTWRPEYKHSTGRKRRRVVALGEWRVDFALQKETAGIDWMTLEELSEAIPPAYTEFIGGLLLEHLSRAGATRAVSPGPPTSSSPAAARGARAPDGVAGAPALDASEAAPAVEPGTARPAGYEPGEVPAPPRTYRPAFVDNDARPVPTTRKTVTVQEDVL